MEFSALERYDVLCRAFQLMNQTFANASKYESWRLFQIVYLTHTDSQLLQLASMTTLKVVKIGNKLMSSGFPTGGGKTEAYLGLIVLYCLL